MDSSDTFSDSEQESDIADSARGMAATPPADAGLGSDKIMSALEENMRANCQVVVVKESTLYSPYDMPRLEVADCIKTLVGNLIIPSDLPGVRMVFPQVPQAVRFKIRNDPNCSMSKYSDCITFIPDTVTFALQAILREMAIPDFGASPSGEGRDSEEVNLNVDIGSSISTLSTKDFISKLLRGEEKLKQNRDHAGNLFAEPVQVKSVPRSMLKPLNQPGRKRKNRRNRPPQSHQSNIASKTAVCDNLPPAPKQKRTSKKEQKKVQKHQRKRKHRG